MPLFKLFLATNHKPYIANQDEGIWRRIRLIPFEKSIPKEEQNPHLVEDVLLPELAGILSWSVQGCLARQDTGLQPPARVLAATEDYRDEMDALAPFIEECFVRGDGYQTPSSAIQEAYVQWCQRNNIRKPLGPKNFISKLKDRGYKDYRTSTGRGLCGLKPKLTTLNKTGLNIDTFHFPWILRSSFPCEFLLAGEISCSDVGIA